MVVIELGCRVRDVMAWMEERFPSGDAEPWDSVGLQIGDPEAWVRGILVALDPTREVVEEARDLGASLVVAHHPVWFGTLGAVRWDEPAGALVLEAVRGGINVFCVHTNLDKANGGPNDLLVAALGLQGVRPLGGGLGRVGDLRQEVPLRELCRLLGPLSSGMRAAGPKQIVITRVAVCCGSGASLIKEAKRFGAQLLVTGDLKYHDARLAEALGLAVLDLGHFSTERSLVPWLAQLLEEASLERGWDVQVTACEAQRDPFWEPKSKYEAIGTPSGR